MQRLGLTAAQLRAYHDTLRTSHERRIVVQIQTLGGRVLTSQQVDVIDGGITVDTDAEVTRVLSMVFVDPSRSIRFETNDPSGVPLHRSRRIEVHYEVRVPALNRWVTAVPFSGPIWDYRRQGAEVTIVAHGMDRQGLGNQWSARTFGKKSRKTRAIRTVLGDIGFEEMSIPDLKKTFPGRFTVARLDQPLPKLRRVARSLDRHLFIDGRGVPRMRAIPNRPVFTFDDRSLVAEPSIRRTTEELKNVAEVLGGKPKGAKRRVRAVAQLRPNHPLSPESLSFNGKPLRLVERVENPHLKTTADCKKRARRIRDERAKLPVEHGFEAVPVPHLDELDLVRVVTDDGPVVIRMKQWSLPLGGSAAGGTGGQPMTVGSLKRVSRTGGGRRR